jgi:MFS family permease
MSDTAHIQRRTLRLLFFTQIISGIGVTIGASVGALLAADLAGVSVSGLAQSAIVVGAALLALPAAAIVQRHGRRPSLAAAYLVAAAGALLTVFAATRGWIPLLFAGFFLFGGASAAGYQARYAATDLAPPHRRGRHLSLIVWATTLGVVAGPSLAPVAGTTLEPYGIPTLAAPFFFSALLFGLAALSLVLLLRPDPAVVARLAPTGTAPERRAPPPPMAAVLRAVLALPPARLAVGAMALGHLVMVGVMAMTPVHIRGAGHDAAATLRIVGVVLSAHVAGMYALAPVMGWLTDRVGPRRVIALGIVLLLGACALAGTAGHATATLAVALTVLGLGWSASVVAGSTLLNASVPGELRVATQGLSDLIMGLAGAAAGAVSGLIVSAWGYPILTLLTALATAPLIVGLALERALKRSSAPA